MIGHLTICTMDATRAHRTSHIRQAESATIGRRAMDQCDLLPGVFPGPAQAHPPAKSAWIRRTEGSLISIYFDIWELEERDVKHGDDRANCTIREFHQPRPM